jgi:hypothetical protein
MRRTLKGTICILLAAAGLVFSRDALAAHATNFLDELQSDVTNRLATEGADLSKAERRALSNAARTLSRNTRTLAADLGVLAATATQLNSQFSDDETFAELEADALADYSAEAHARLEGIYLWIGTNELSRGLSNQLARAADALDRADAETNGVPAQARALASAFNRILPLERKVQRLFDAPAGGLPPEIEPPVNVPPVILPPGVPAGTPGLAVDSVGTRHVNLWENDVVNDQTVFYLSTAQTGSQIYNVHHPEELGLWSYIRTGADTAVIVVAPNYPGNASPRMMNLTFTSASGGTFTGTTYFGQALEGTFAVIQ